MTENGWKEYQKLVLAQLEDHSTDIKELTQEIQRLRAIDLAKVRTEIALLKAKSAIWGAGAGAGIGAIISTLIASFGT